MMVATKMATNNPIAIVAPYDMFMKVKKVLTKYTL